MELMEDCGGREGLMEVEANVGLLNLVVPDVKWKKDELITVDPDRIALEF